MSIQNVAPYHPVMPNIMNLINALLGVLQMLRFFCGDIPIYIYTFRSKIFLYVCKYICSIRSTCSTPIYKYIYIIEIYIYL